MIRTTAPAPSGAVTFLFTDMEGSTALWNDNPSAMSEAQARHDDILGRHLEAHSGYVFSVGGDGYGAAFARATDALDAAVGIQLDLGAEPWPDGATVRVRMGIHTGEAEERAGNYFGPSVNHAARLMGAANGGQLVVSDVTAGFFTDRHDLTLLDLGPVSLKGMANPVAVLGVATPDLPWIDRPLTAPAPGQGTGTGGVAGGNLPRFRTDFVGPPASIHDLAASVRATGLTTLTGPAGVGKSRLAIEVAWLVVDHFPDGIWLTELAPVGPGDDPIEAVASALSLQPQPGLTTVEAITDWCVGRQALLVFDNCEHVRTPMAELAAAVLAADPTITIMATSQVPLGIGAETVWPLAGLAPEVGAELFRVRARAGGATDLGGPDGAGEPTILERLSHRLDGLPLAIELAAARARLLRPSELLDRLDDRLRLLRTSDPTVAARHQTLQAAVDWSYRLLDRSQQQVLDQLSVFAGTFDLGAVTSVVLVDDAPLDEVDTIDRLGALVDSSLVEVVPSEPANRYRLAETVRHHATERLAGWDANQAAHDRHLAHYRRVAREIHGTWFSPAQPLADRRFELEWDNLRAAHRRAMTTAHPEAAQDLMVATAWHALERLRYEHRGWTAEAVELAAQSDASHPSAHAVLAAWAYFAADLEQCIDLCLRAVERHPDHPEIVACHGWLLYGLLGADLASEAEPVRAALVAGLEAEVAVEVELMGRMALADASLSLPSDTHDRALTALCQRIGSPMALARAAQLRANRLLSLDPPDLEGAMAGYRRALAVGGDHAPSERLWSLGGLAMCLVLVDDEGAADALRLAVEGAHDARLWFELDLALGHCASYLLARSPRAAAAILGHIAPRPPSAIGATTAARRAALAEVETWAEGGRWMAEGAGLDRHAIVELTLAALGALGHAGP